MSKQLNFAQQMNEVLKTLGPARPKLLLHACCGPCSSAVLEQLCEHFEITVLYYNPNTWPAAEYHRRGEVGSGLGLSIVKGILDGYGAHYGVTSKLGCGSTFWFELPISDSPEHGNAAAPDDGLK